MVTAVVPHPFDVDIASPGSNVPAYLGFDFISGEDMSHEIVLTLTNNGEAVSLSGATAFINVVRTADGETVIHEASIAENAIRAKLSAESFAYPNRRVFIRASVETGTEKKIVFNRYSNVGEGMTDVTVLPGEVVNLLTTGEQTLSSGQKTQVLDNLGAASKAASPTADHIATLTAAGNPKDSGKSLEDLATSEHVHGNITKDGEIGSTADLPVFTTTGGELATRSASDALAALGIPAYTTDANGFTRIKIGTINIWAKTTHFTDTYGGDLNNFTPGEVRALLYGSVLTPTAMTTQLVYTYSSRVDGCANEFLVAQELTTLYIKNIGGSTVSTGGVYFNQIYIGLDA